MAKPLRQHGQHDLRGHDPITGHAWRSRDAVNIRSNTTTLAVSLSTGNLILILYSHVMCLVVLGHISILGDSVNQTCHNFMGEIRIFSVKICINPYPSFMHRCIAKTFTRFISRSSLPKKMRHCVIKIDIQQQRTKIRALLHVARLSD